MWNYRLASLRPTEIGSKDEVPTGGGYRLTPRGIDLLPIMMEIIGWSAKHDSRTAADREFVRRLRADRDAFTKELRATLRAAHVSGRPLERVTKRTEVVS